MNKDYELYVIRKEDNFKHLSLITTNLQEILDFIKFLDSTDKNAFYYEIK